MLICLLAIALMDPRAIRHIGRIYRTAYRPSHLAELIATFFSANPARSRDEGRFTFPPCAGPYKSSRL